MKRKKEVLESQKKRARVKLEILLSLVFASLGSQQSARSHMHACRHPARLISVAALVTLSEFISFWEEKGWDLKREPITTFILDLDLVWGYTSGKGANQRAQLSQAIVAEGRWLYVQREQKTDKNLFSLKSYFLAGNKICDKSCPDWMRMCHKPLSINPIIQSKKILFHFFYLEDESIEVNEKGKETSETTFLRDFGSLYNFISLKGPWQIHFWWVTAKSALLLVRQILRSTRQSWRKTRCNHAIHSFWSRDAWKIAARICVLKMEKVVWMCSRDQNEMTLSIMVPIIVLPSKLRLLHYPSLACSSSQLQFCFWFVFIYTYFFYITLQLLRIARTLFYSQYLDNAWDKEDTSQRYVM